MSDWKIGDRVRVAEDYTSPYPETVCLDGTITGIETLEFEGDQHSDSAFARSIDIPVITLDDGTVLRGYECWWRLL
jgi:hypothetical protein